ncbi:MAG: carbohydrate ABC transporter permease [Caldilinea sp. CFX5]|nr:carbohydrate ABC transporter permease [Caldilinea sp. CFX5]
MVGAESQPKGRRVRWQAVAGKVAVYLLLAGGAILFIAPWAWMVSASFQPLGDIFNWPPTWLPENPTLDNYVRFLAAADLGLLFGNSGIVATSVTLLQLFFNSLAAYTFAKRRFPGRDFLFLLMLGTLMIPGQVTLIPSYLILQHIPFFGDNNWLGQGGHGWLDSFWGLIAPGAVSTYGIFLLRQYMKTIPDELLDAARIDGAAEFRIYAQIVVPLSLPALAAMGIFTFTYAWNDFFWPLIIISSPDLRTLPLGLALFVVKNRTVWDLVMAGSVLATLPVLLLFLIFQRHFIRGIALTGMR